MDKCTNTKDELKSNIRKVWIKTRETINPNMKRGHSRSISTEVEDQIALLVLTLLGTGYTIYIDPSITISGKTHRPDLLVVKNGSVVAMMEIKSNMGYCRDAKEVIDKIKIVDDIFRGKRELECKFSRINEEDEYFDIFYGENVKLYLVALTSKNGGSAENISRNKNYAVSSNVKHYLLFDNWYDDLQDKDIDSFIDEIDLMKD